MSLRQLVRNFLKRIYISSYKNVFIAKSARIGNYSRLIVTEDHNDKNSDTKISLLDHAGIGRNNELQVWDGNQIILKEYCSLNDNCKILGDVTIEKYCTFSANIYASSGNHYATTKPSWLVKDQDVFVLSTEKGRKEHSKKIHFEEDCWIGYGVFIKQGIYIGRGAVIGAYTVVTKNVLPYSVQIGSPNKEIKKRLSFIPPSEISFDKDEHLPYFYRGFSHRQNELEKSRKNNIILADPESIITLVHLDDPIEVCIIGKNLIYPAALDLSISVNGRYTQAIQITTAAIEFKLNIGEAINSQKDVLYMSLSKELKEYSIISIVTQPVSENSVRSHLGITSVKIK